MSWQEPRVLSSDPDTGIRELFYYDPDGDRSRIETVQEVDPILADCKAHMAETDERTRWKGEMHRVASIPLVLFYKLLREGIIHDKKAMKRWLNDPENRSFRIRPGRI
jgi:hypothetical protein